MFSRQVNRGRSFLAALHTSALASKARQLHLRAHTSLDVPEAPAAIADCSTRVTAISSASYARLCFRVNSRCFRNEREQVP